MQESANREARNSIIKKVRSALIQKTKNPYPSLSLDEAVYRENEELPELIFAQQFSEAGGNFIFCENLIEFAESLLHLSAEKKWKKIVCSEKKLSALLNEIEFPHTAAQEAPDVIFSSCECLVARTGSFVVSPFNGFDKTQGVSQVVYATTDQLVQEMKDAFTLLKNKYNNSLPSSLTFFTGQAPKQSENKTAKPTELFLFLVDEA